MTVLTLITLTGHKRGSESEPFTQSHSIPINAFCSLPLEMAGSNGSSLMGWINAFETFWDRTHPLKFPLQVCLRKTTMQISKPVAFTNSLSSFCSSAIIKNNKGSASSSASLCSEGGLPSWEVVQMLDIGYTWFEYLPLYVSKKLHCVNLINVCGSCVEWQLHIYISYILIVGLDGSQLTLGLRKESTITVTLRPIDQQSNSAPWQLASQARCQEGCLAAEHLHQGLQKLEFWRTQQHIVTSVLSRLAGQGRRENKSPTAIFPLSQKQVANPPTTWRVSWVLGDAVFCRAQGAILLQIDERSGRVSWSGDQRQTSWVPRKFTKPVVIWRFPNMRVTPRIIHVYMIFHEINHYKPSILVVPPVYGKPHMLLVDISQSVSPRQPQPHRIPPFFLGSHSESSLLVW